MTTITAWLADMHHAAGLFVTQLRSLEEEARRAFRRNDAAALQVFCLAAHQHCHDLDFRLIVRLEGSTVAFRLTAPEPAARPGQAAGLSRPGKRP